MEVTKTPKIISLTKGVSITKETITSLSAAEAIAIAAGKRLADVNMLFDLDFIKRARAALNLKSFRRKESVVELICLKSGGMPKYEGNYRINRDTMPMNFDFRSKNDHHNTWISGYAWYEGLQTYVSANRAARRGGVTTLDIRYNTLSIGYWNGDNTAENHYGHWILLDPGYEIPLPRIEITGVTKQQFDLILTCRVT